jgi:tetratricopeptide (TPR) repeat protein
MNKIFFSKNTKSLLKKKYDSCVISTLEEFKILNDYAPNDPWIHLQLAQSYKKLNLKKEQIKEYEIIYKLCPNDNNILFKLGTLYFETKRNSKGLRIYEELKMRSYKDADQLLFCYGIYKTQEILEEST